MKSKIFFFFLFVFIVNVFSNSYNFSIDIPNPQRNIFENNYIYYFFPGAAIVGEPGDPLLPVIPYIFTLPNDQKVVDINIVNCFDLLLEKNINITPNQGSYPISYKGEIDFIYLDIFDKNLSIPFPNNQIYKYIDGRIYNKNIVIVYIAPLYYDLNNFDIYLNKNIEIEIITENQNISTYNINDTIMTIITPNEFIQQAESLAVYHIRNGKNVSVITTEWIKSNYSGRDEQEKYRNYIKDIFQTNNNILLFGGWSKIPGRYCFIQMQTLSENIPTDLYYSDLNGSWDANNNNIFGEIDDSIDFFPDIYVGRAPVNSQAEAWNFVNKTISYSQAEHRNYIENINFTANYLDAETDGGIAKNIIDNFLIPNDFNIIKLYESLSNLSVTTFINNINTNGFSFLNHIGHASTTSMQCGYDYLSLSDISSLTNLNKGGVVYSTGCWASAYDDDCIGSRFIKNPNGGAISFIGNSRYGWYTPGFPGCGSSDVIDYNFYKTIFSDSINNLGYAFAFHKIPYIGLAQEETDYRWLQYALNLFGDPLLDLWYSAEIKDIFVGLPYLVFPENSGSIPISVSDTNLNPLENILISLSIDSTLITNEYTNGSGKAILFYNNITSLTGKLNITGDNIIPYSIDISFNSANYRIQIDSIVVIDSFNQTLNDNLVAPGEKFTLDIYLKNSGIENITDIIGQLLSNSQYTIFHKHYDSINILNTSETGKLSYILEADSISPDHADLGLDLFILSTQYQDTFPIPLEVNAPLLQCFRYICYDTIVGNSNNYFNPGETVLYKFFFINNGSSPVYNITSKIRINNQYINIIDSTASSNTVNPGDTVVFNYILSSSTQTPSYMKFQTDHIFYSDNNYLGGKADTVYLAIGNLGFYDDMEYGNINWTHSGIEDIWHITSRKSHSGDSSWYCGIDSTGMYLPNFADTLESNYILSGENMNMSFWQWYQVEGGYDYCMVQILDNTQWINLATYTGNSNGWTNEIIPIKIDQDSFKVRFIFYSEDNPYQFEGWYIDDVYIYSTQVNIEEEIVENKDLLKIINLNNSINFNLSISQSQDISLKIYDISGREVLNIFKGNLNSGNHVFSLSNNITSGIYFLRVMGETINKNLKFFKIR